LYKRYNFTGLASAGHGLVAKKSFQVQRTDIERRRTSVNSAPALDVGDGQKAFLDATSSFLPFGFQKGELFPHFVEHLSCSDEAAPLFFQNHQVASGKCRDAPVSYGPPKAGSTTPLKPPEEPWHSPDRRYREECARASRHILAQLAWLDARGNVNFCMSDRSTVADWRSRRKTPPKSLFHWRVGAWPAPPGTASANQPAASRWF
jgi:hypothetical protein